MKQNQVVQIIFIALIPDLLGELIDGFLSW